MATAKDNTDLLRSLLIVHLAPTTKAEIDRALRGYRNLKGKAYGVKADELIGGITAPSNDLPAIVTTEMTGEASAAEADVFADVEEGDSED